MSTPAGQDSTEENVRVITFQSLLAASTPRFFVTPAILALDVLVFVLMVLTGVSLFDPEIERMLDWGANYGPLTLGGEWWRLVTANFVHIGLLHLALNMQCLWSLGRLAERMFGNGAFLALYLLSGLGGSVASLWRNPTIVSAGASGAIFGVAGGIVVFLYRGKLSLPRQVVNRNLTSILVFVGYNLLYGFSNSGIDNAAHLGGFVTGLVLGALLRRPLPPLEIRPRSRQRLAVAGVLLFLVAGAGAVARMNDSLVVNERAIDHYNRGVDYQERDELAPAIEAYTQALDLDPELVQAYVNRGLAYFRQGQLGPAIADFDRAIDLDPREGLAYYNRGLAYATAGQYEQALHDLSAAIQSDPGNADLYFFRGAVYAELGAREAAIADLESALELGLDPRFEQNAQALLKELK
jgi:membrane associated rhomboid family serine protease/regulator of sirC expression with transglutaminase-like and TPR domain